MKNIKGENGVAKTVVDAPNALQKQIEYSDILAYPTFQNAYILHTIIAHYKLVAENNR